jgi:hypothetical protein
MLDFLKGLLTAIAAVAIIRFAAEILFEKAGLYL